MLSALQASLRFLPNVVIGTLVSFGTDAVLHRWDAYRYVTIMLLISCVAPLLMALMDPAWSYWYMAFWGMLLLPFAGDGGFKLFQSDSKMCGADRTISSIHRWCLDHHGQLLGLGPISSRIDSQYCLPVRKFCRLGGDGCHLNQCIGCLIPFWRQTYTRVTGGLSCCILDTSRSRSAILLCRSDRAAWDRQDRAQERVINFSDKVMGLRVGTCQNRGTLMMILYGSWVGIGKIVVVSGSASYRSHS